MLGIPELSSSVISQQIDHNNTTVFSIYKSLGNAVPNNLKLIRLGKQHPDVIRPLKVICENKESTMKLLYEFISARRSVKLFPNVSRMTRNKTLLQ